MIDQKENIKRIVYIALTGYGPCSDFTLAEWLEARAILATNREKYLTTVAPQRNAPMK